MSRHTPFSSAPTAALALIVSAALVLATTFFSIRYGVRDITVLDAWQALLGHTDTPAQAAAAARIPRTVLGLLVGAALAVSGTCFQAVTRNPLADPGIFGILSGAALAVAVSYAFLHTLSASSTILAAITGAALASAAVYAIGTLGGASPLKLALAGAVIAAACSSLTTAILLPRSHVMDSFRLWQIGGIGGAQWDRILAALPLMAIGFALCWVLASAMNALALGDATATALGHRVGLVRAGSFTGAVLLAGTATALAGPIAFVGLIIPHMYRLTTGVDHRVLIPLSALGGGALLVAADTVGRIIAKPEEIAVGVLLPVLGAPLFLWLIRTNKVKEL